MGSVRDESLAFCAQAQARGWVQGQCCVPGVCVCRCTCEIFLRWQADVKVSARAPNGEG